MPTDAGAPPASRRAAPATRGHELVARVRARVDRIGDHLPLAVQANSKELGAPNVYADRERRLAPAPLGIRDHLCSPPSRRTLRRLIPPSQRSRSATLMRSYSRTCGCGRIMNSPDSSADKTGGHRVRFEYLPAGLDLGLTGGVPRDHRSPHSLGAETVELHPFAP